MAVVLDDPVLSPIAGMMVEPQCSEQRWQVTQASAVATFFGGEGLGEVHGLDVTMLVRFRVDNASVVRVDDNVVSPVAEGMTSVLVDRAWTGILVGALVRVDPEPVVVTGIVSLIVSEAGWESPGVPTVAPGSGDGRDPYAAFTATAVLRSRLVSELTVANMYLWASLNDTTSIPLSYADAQGATVRALRTRDVALVHTSLVECTSGSDPLSDFEVSWVLNCDGSYVSNGGAGFSQVVAIPRLSTHSMSSCTLSLTDEGANGWNGAHWSGFGQRGLSLVTGSSTELSFTVVEPAAPPHFQIGVPRRAGSGSGEAFALSWGSCGQPVVNDSAPLVIEISPPVSIVGSVVWLQKPGAAEAPTALTPPGDAAMAVPFLLQTEATLSFNVTFAAGHRRAFETDDRLELQTWPAGCANATLVPARVAVLDGASCNEITIFASIPSLTGGGPSVNTTVVVPVAKLASVTIQHNACPPKASEQDVLRPIGCSGIYQTSQLLAFAALDTGVTQDVTQFASWSSSNSSVLHVECLNGCAPRRIDEHTLVNEPYHAVPLSAGSASVLVYFEQPQHTTSADFLVVDEPANVTSIALSVGSSLNPVSHFGFARFSTMTSVQFDDQSHINDLEGFTCGVSTSDTFVLGARLIAPQMTWPDPGSGGLGKQGGSPIINVSSAEPGVVSLSPDVHGDQRLIVVTTLANKAWPVEITAMDVCG